MGPCTADLKRLYRELGLEMSSRSSELPDHVAVELEALSYALMFEKTPVIARELLFAHLGHWLPATLQGRRPRDRARLLPRTGRGHTRLAGRREGLPRRSRRRLMAPRETPVVLLCADLANGPWPLRLGMLAARLRSELATEAIFAAPEICARPNTLTDGLAALEPRRVVVGCSGDPEAQQALLVHLRQGGLSHGSAEVVDLRPAETCTEQAALEQSVALLRAAVALVEAADLEAPVRERTDLSRAVVSRRGLLHLVDSARRPVAVWRPERCKKGASCLACVLACPHDALRREADHVIVDSTSCTGCGACVAACRKGAFALPGASLEALGDAASVLAEAASRGAANGVAITCGSSGSAPRWGINGSGFAFLRCRSSLADGSFRYSPPGRGRWSFPAASPAASSALGTSNGSSATSA